MNSITSRLNKINNAIEIPIAEFLGVKQFWVSGTIFFIAYGSLAAFFLLY
jgi:hypothetical protein